MSHQILMLLIWTVSLQLNTNEFNVYKRTCGSVRIGCIFAVTFQPLEVWKCEGLKNTSCARGKKWWLRNWNGGELTKVFKAFDNVSSTSLSNYITCALSGKHEMLLQSRCNSTSGLRLHWKICTMCMVSLAHKTKSLLRRLLKFYYILFQW